MCNISCQTNVQHFSLLSHFTPRTTLPCFCYLFFNTLNTNTHLDFPLQCCDPASSPSKVAPKNAYAHRYLIHCRYTVYAGYCWCPSHHWAVRVCPDGSQWRWSLVARDCADLVAHQRHHHRPQRHSAGQAAHWCIVDPVHVPRSPLELVGDAMRPSGTKLKHKKKCVS